jgi:hypothetical protein
MRELLFIYKMLLMKKRKTRYPKSQLDSNPMGYTTNVWDVFSSILTHFHSYQLCLASTPYNV